MRAEREREKERDELREEKFKGIFLSRISLIKAYYYLSEKSCSLVVFLGDECPDNRRCFEKSPSNIPPLSLRHFNPLSYTFHTLHLCN
jgi:hypothetical protein